MKSMDVFFADPVVVPPDEKHLFTEQVYDLPSVIPYFNPSTFPDVGPLPALSGQGITFGAFNRLAKVSDTVLATWAEILRVVPSSQLVIKAGDLNSDTARQQVLSRFEAQGVTADRIKLIGPSDWSSHMAAYNQIDICLDPFPLGGGITSLEGLRMGVPVVAMHWPTIAGRLSSSILTTLGMTDWIAGNRADYVAIAARMAQDLTKLADLRAGLRARFDKSVLGDTAAYVSAAEQAYRTLWRQWCDRQTTASIIVGPELQQGVPRLTEPEGQSA
jgi:predicted O-linked N-acetylglucosamine transferase (SPINDLY family)